MAGDNAFGATNEIRLERTVDGVRYKARAWLDHRHYDDAGETIPLFRVSAFPEMKPGETSAASIPNEEIERIFPEFASIAQVDRSTFDGVPVNVESRGRTALGFGVRHALPRGLNDRPAEQDLGQLARAWRVSDQEARDISARVQESFAGAVKLIVSADSGVRNGVRPEPGESIEQAVLRNPTTRGWINNRVREVVNGAIAREIDLLRPRWEAEAKAAMEVYGQRQPGADAPAAKGTAPAEPRVTVGAETWVKVGPSHVAAPPSVGSPFYAEVPNPNRKPRAADVDTQPKTAPAQALIAAMEAVEDTPEKRTILSALRDNFRSFREALVDFVADPVNRAVLGLGDRLLNASFPFEKVIAAKIPAMPRDTRAEVISGIADRIENGPRHDRGDGPSMR